MRAFLALPLLLLLASPGASAGAMVDADGDGYATDTDCDDANAAAHPGASEVVADGIDQDCDGGDACYVDDDGDGYGASTTAASADLDCDDRYEAATDGDCDDTTWWTSPGEAEYPGDGIDENCDGIEQCYYDADHDGYAGGSRYDSDDMDCDDPGEWTTETDCNDNDPNVYPDAEELPADGVDSNCNTQEACYVDFDHDEWGGSNTVEINDRSCDRAGYAWWPGDCNDHDASVHPRAEEIPGDGLDSDCDGYEICFPDEDGDGHGAAVPTPTKALTCEEVGMTASPDDCDDTDAAIGPGAPETCNGVDDNCDGAVDEALTDCGGDTADTAADTAADTGEEGDTGAPPPAAAHGCATSPPGAPFAASLPGLAALLAASLPARRRRAPLSTRTAP